MEIRVKKVGKYREVVVTHDSTRVDMGLLDKAELMALARTLEEAVDDLTDGLDEGEAA